MNTPVYNFSAGPAVLPEAVLRQAQAEMLDYKGTGFPIMAMSHRSAQFESILHHAEHNLRRLLNIPNNYKILFLQGGASAQFNMVALNLGNGFNRADAVVSGNWSKLAYKNMGKLTDLDIHLAANGEASFGFQDLPSFDSWDVSQDSAFVHFVSNETVHGLQYQELPTGENMPPLVCDMSSDILSRPVNVEDFGIIYAGAQKNIGPSGATIVIIREDLLERSGSHLPDVWSYKSHVEKDGMYNTPATYPIYMANLVFEWLLAQGGVSKIQQINDVKAKLIYDAIDNSNGFYINPIAPSVRSKMNVVFRTAAGPDLDAKFILESELAHLMLLKGYKAVGGMRASIYNAMPIEGVLKLVDFMKDFQRRYG